MFNFTIHFKTGDRQQTVDVVAQDDDQAVLLARLGPGAEIITVSCTGEFMALPARKESRGFHSDWRSLPPAPRGIFEW